MASPLPLLRFFLHSAPNKNLFFKEQPEWAFKNVSWILSLPFSKPSLLSSSLPHLQVSVDVVPAYLVNLTPPTVMGHLYPRLLTSPQLLYSGYDAFLLAPETYRSRLRASFFLCLECDFPKLSWLPPSLVFRSFSRCPILTSFRWPPSWK